MDDTEYTNIAQNESNHFYYVSVHELVLGLIEQNFRSNKSQLQILDAGCGTGSLAEKMCKLGTVRAVDMHDEALRYSSSRGINVTKASVESLPFPDKEFDLVTSIDVIYHKFVNDDVAALKEFFRVLKPGGVLVLRVPADPQLFSSHDEVVQTARRYLKSELKSKLKAAGFKIQRLTYCQSPLYIPALVKAKLDRRKTDSHSSAIENESNVLNSTIRSVLAVENKCLLSGLNAPRGIGLITVSNKPR
ncbi:MAG TPA: class I SAM-dependent methyltransferase [Drouetiella sp.]